jgi:hypothetical protein
MPVVPNNLMLSEGQVEVLSEMGIHPDAIYIIKGETLHASAVRIDGYTNGHYVFFLEGNATEHATFLKYLFGDNYSLILPTRFRGVSVYGGPTQKYVTGQNLVSVQSATSTPVSYTG